MSLHPILNARGGAAVSSKSANAVVVAPTNVRKPSECQQFGAIKYAGFGVVVSVISAMTIATSSAAIGREAPSSHLPDGASHTACLPWQRPIEASQLGAAELSKDFTPMPNAGARWINTACLPWRAPIGHRQPRAADVPGNFTPVRPEPLTPDTAIDRTLNICRC
jgi:hypothetical protein